jgi:capsular polysaccharide transport system permease protein
MSNEDRIRKWRQFKAADLAQTEGAQPEGASAGVVGAAPSDGGQRVPTRREEQLAEEERRRADLADSRLPTDQQIEREVTSESLRRWEKSRTLRRHALTFVGLPLLLVALYGLLFAPSTYTARASFVIMTAGAEGEVSPAMGLLGGAGGAGGLTDAYRIREYLLSREAMQAMERQYGLLSHFTNGTYDPFQRPQDMPLLGMDPHDFYKRKVAITVDVREGIARVSVDALAPKDAQRFASGLLALARARTQNISDQLNADQFKALQQDVLQAESDLNNASARVSAVQRQTAELDPQMSATAINQLISDLEVRLAEAQAERTGITANGLNESPLLPRLNARIVALKQQIADQRAKLIGGRDRTVQKAAAALETATIKRQLAQTSLESMLRTFEQAKLRSIENRRYMVVVANPVLPEQVRTSRLFNLLLITGLAALLLWGLISTLRSSRYLRSIR